MVDSPLGKIPDGWEVEPLANLVETRYGYTESAQDSPIGPKFLRGMDINKNSCIDWNNVPYCKISGENQPKFRLRRGDIVVIRMADPGKVGIVEQEVDAVFASYLVRLRINANRLLPYYLFYFLLSDRYQAYVTGASTGTTRKSASSGVITGIDILIPDLDFLRQYDDKICKIRQFIINLLRRNITLRQTRDLLLPKLISGELDVSDLDISMSEEAA
jgi:type I restriction enzyme S subunit